MESILISLCFAVGNYWARRLGGFKNDKRGQLEAFLVGVVAGPIIVSTWYVLFSCCLTTIHWELWIGLFGVVSIGSLLIELIILRIQNRPLLQLKSIRLFWGLFYTDPNRSVLKQAIQMVTRHTWEILQTLLGYTYSQILNGVNFFDRVDLFGGVTFAYRCTKSQCNGVSIGNYIHLQHHLPKINLVGEFLPMHEYGHTFQSQIWGPGYLFFIGIPSLISALLSNNHHDRWYEKQTDRFAAQYFHRFYGAKYPRKSV